MTLGIPSLLGLSIFWSTVITLAILVGGAARFVRLIVAEDFPPILWLRVRWNHYTREGTRLEHWNELPKCPWCSGPWMTLFALLTGYFSHWHWVWYAFWGWLALSYITSWIVFHDEDGAPQ